MRLENYPQCATQCATQLDSQNQMKRANFSELEVNQLALITEIAKRELKTNSHLQKIFELYHAFRWY